MTIEIAAGTYNENVNLTQSNVTLIGQGDSTIIEGTFKSSNGIADGGVATFLESGHSYTQSAGSGVGTEIPGTTGSKTNRWRLSILTVYGSPRPRG